MSQGPPGGVTAAGAASAAAAECASSAGRRARRRGCRVPGCTRELEGGYNTKYRCCQHHALIPSLKIDGRACRFCQQCANFHPLDMFDEGRRSCRESLERHRARRQATKQQRRRQRAAEEDGGGSCSASETAASAGATPMAAGEAWLHPAQLRAGEHTLVVEVRQVTPPPALTCAAKRQRCDPAPGDAAQAAQQRCDSAGPSDSAGLQPPSPFAAQPPAPARSSLLPRAVPLGDQLVSLANTDPSGRLSTMLSTAAGPSLPLAAQLELAMNAQLGVAQPPAAAGPPPPQLYACLPSAQAPAGMAPAQAQLQPAQLSSRLPSVQLSARLPSAQLYPRLQSAQLPPMPSAQLPPMPPRQHAMPSTPPHAAAPTSPPLPPFGGWVPNAAPSMEPAAPGAAPAAPEPCASLVGEAMAMLRRDTEPFADVPTEAELLAFDASLGLDLH